MDFLYRGPNPSLCADLASFPLRASLCQDELRSRCE